MPASVPASFIDPQHPFSSWFLWIFGVVFLAVFALPLLVAPLGWARRFGWVLPRERRLVCYFGRCLGAVALAIVICVLGAAPHPQAQPVLFELLFLGAVGLTGVHVWGALRHAQPASETVEILLYGGVAMLVWWLRHTGA